MSLTASSQVLWLAGFLPWTPWDCKLIAQEPWEGPPPEKTRSRSGSNSAADWHADLPAGLSHTIAVVTLWRWRGVVVASVAAGRGSWLRKMAAGKPFDRGVVAPRSNAKVVTSAAKSLIWVRQRLDQMAPRSNAKGSVIIVTVVAKSFD